MTTVLDFIRGIVRPTTLLTVVGGVVGLAIYYGVTVDAKEAALLLPAFGGHAMGFWFRERTHREPEVTIDEFIPDPRTFVDGVPEDEIGLD